MSKKRKTLSPALNKPEPKKEEEVPYPLLITARDLGIEEEVTQIVARVRELAGPGCEVDFMTHNYGMDYSIRFSARGVELGYRVYSKVQRSEKGVPVVIRSIDPQAFLASLRTVSKNFTNQVMQ